MLVCLVSNNNKSLLIIVILVTRKLNKSMNWGISIVVMKQSKEELNI